jgi:hypothetical protein
MVHVPFNRQALAYPTVRKTVTAATHDVAFLWLSEKSEA